MPALLIAEECRDYLVAQGLVKKPSTASGSQPKCFVEPLTGAPSPEEAGTNLTLRYAGGLPSPSYGEFVDQVDLDFIIRSADLRTALELGLSISDKLDGKRGLMLDTLRVEQITRNRPFDRLMGPDQPASYTLIGQFRFMVRKAVQV